MSLLNDASLVFIPSGYKEDKVYSIIPSNGAGDLDFVRGCDATRINPQSLVEGVSWNLLQQSETFNVSPWATLNSATVTANSTIAPNGTTTADTLTFSSNASSCIYQSILSPAGQTTLSIYAKTASGTKQFRLRIDAPNANESNNFTATTEWQRFEYNLTTTAFGDKFYIINDDPGTAGSIYIWGAQLNSGTIKPYFPTTDRLNVPRLDYKNSTCPSLLLEKQSTNIALYSEQFDNAAWDKINVTVTANNITSPDGTINADKIEYTNANNYFITYSTNNQNTSYTISAYAKKGTTNLFSLREVFYFGSTARFDLTNGSIVSDTTGTAKIENVGNGWYRCSITQAYTSGQTNVHWSFDNRTSTGNLYLWGAQIEAGSYPTSYIPTTSATATRLADSCSKTGISSLIGQTSGSMFIDFNYFDNIAGSLELVPMYIGAGAYSDGIYFDVYQDVLYLAIWNSASQQALINCGSLNNGRCKAAVSYTTNDITVYVNGVLKGTDTSATIPTLSQLNLGTAGASTTVEAHSINQALLFKRVLTNTELEKLTTL